MSGNPWPFEEFSRSVAGPGNWSFAMLVAYFDESGTHGNSTLVSVAGLLGSSQEWARIEKPWAERLKPFKCFHATDCESSLKEFTTFPSGDNKTKLSTDLAKIIANGRFAGVSCSMPRGDWQYGSSLGMKARFQDIYHFCFSAVISLVNALSREHGNSEPVAFVFAEQKQYQEYAKKIHEIFASDRANYPSVGSITFTSPNLLIPLQAADLFSYEVYREFEAKISNTDQSKVLPRAQMQALSKIPRQSRLGNMESVHLLAQEFDKLDAILASSSEER